MTAPETILHIDTATSRLMLGLSQDSAWLGRQTVPCDSHRYHSALMVPAIQDMLAAVGVKIADLTALAVNAGPGSFTGIRTGMITVRTMAQFLHLPVYSFNAFELLAQAHAPHAEAPIAIYMDALRGRAYHAALHFGPSGPVYAQNPSFLKLDDSDLQAPGPSLLISPALARFFAQSDPAFISDEWFTPEAMLALIQRYGMHFARDWQAVKPFYLQEPSITLKKSPAP